ncbi:MAG: glycosyltransferase, partial [Limisphaerales bacterium]
MRVGFLAVDAREFHKDYDTPQPYFGTAPHALLQGLAQVPEVEVHVVSCIKRPVAETPKLAPNIFYHSLLTPGQWTRTLYARCVMATRRKLWQLKPDIVHGQGAERDCALAAVYSGFPNIITIHGNMREIARVTRASAFSFARIQSIFESWAIRRTIGVVALTNYARAQVEGRTPRTWVVPNAVNESYFALKRDRNPTADIVCVANIGIRKNQNFLIRALDPIAEKMGIRLIFLGLTDESDPYVKEFLSLVKARSWCVYAGFKRGDELN